MTGRPTRHGRDLLALVAALGLVVAACGAAAPADRVTGAPAATEPPSAATGDEAAPAPTTEPAPSPSPTALPVPTVTTPDPRLDDPSLLPRDLVATALADNVAALHDLEVDVTLLVTSGGEPVVASFSERELIPASNQKLVTAAGVLELLPGDFAFVTDFRLSAGGSLFVTGGGDPGLTSAVVQEVIDGLVDDGVTEIDDVIIDPFRYATDRTAPGWLPRNMPWDIGPLSGLLLDRNWHRTDDEYLADPDLGNAQRVIDLLEASDIEVTGRARVGVTDLTAPLIRRHRSPELETLVRSMLRFSDNMLAESLVREVGLRIGGLGHTPTGATIIAEHLRNEGLDPGTIGDGSGLSRANRLSADQIVALLGWLGDRPYAELVLDALAPAGGEGTLAARLEADTTVGNVRAKTGTLQDVRALSGVVTTVDGLPLVFAIVANGPDAAIAVPVMDQIVTLLASATEADLGS